MGNEKCSIWKYTLELDLPNLIMMPDGAEFISVQIQMGNICMWMQVNPDASRVSRLFRLFGTGWEINKDDLLSHALGTIQIMNGMQIYHLYECKIHECGD